MVHFGLTVFRLTWHCESSLPHEGSDYVAKFSYLMQQGVLLKTLCSEFLPNFISCVVTGIFFLNASLLSHLHSPDECRWSGTKVKSNDFKLQSLISKPCP